MSVTGVAADMMTRMTGFRLVRARPTRNHATLMRLKAAELGARTILDIGANAGYFADEIRHAGWTGPVVSFEPLRAVHAELTARAAGDPHWIVPPAMAIGAEDGEAVINVSANSVSSSLLPVEERSTAVAAASGYSGTETIQVRRLDGVIDPAWEGPFAIKVDTQGFEMEVLRGAPETLARTVVAVLEMSLVPLYSGGASFADLYRFMEQAGFRCIALTEGFADLARNEVLQVDGVFVRG